MSLKFSGVEIEQAKIQKIKRLHCEFLPEQFLAEIVQKALAQVFMGNGGAADESRLLDKDKLHEKRARVDRAIAIHRFFNPSLIHHRCKPWATRSNTLFPLEQIAYIDIESLSAS
ncbi:hypothetical protein CBL_08675 [Carabus blaptoides fortunei]